MIRAIVDLALRNRLLVLLLSGLVCLLGSIAYQRMPKDIYPDLNAPLVNIITSCPGMAAEDVERMISFPLESLMHGTPHVTRVRSESTTGESVVTVEFDWGIDIYHARQIVAGKLEIVAERLPAEASRPVMGPVSSRMGEVFEFAVVGNDVDPIELRSVADWTIRYRLLGVEGVSFVINLGGFVRQYQVLLKPEMLRHYGITVAQIKQAIEKSNRNFSGGIITRKNQEFLIKGEGRIASLKHLENTVITSRNHIPVFLKDVADVKLGGKFRRDDAGLNGMEAVSTVVQKQYGGDTLKTIANIKQFLADVTRHIPAGIRDKVQIVPYYDQSELIVGALRHVEVSMLEGGLLVALVVLVFLASSRGLWIAGLGLGALAGLWLALVHFAGVPLSAVVLAGLVAVLAMALILPDLRASLIASLTIPISILFSLILMELAGVAVTVMALGGLAIGIGKMASGSVIVVENIWRFRQTHPGGLSSLEAAALGAKEIGPYLFSANLIIILVFLPLLALGGIAGRMFRPTAFALIVSLFSALILNITLQPVLMSFGAKNGPGPTRQNPLVALATRTYEAVLHASFRHKPVVLLCAGAILVAGGLCYQRLGSEFVPFLDEGSIIASSVMLPETSLEESIRIGKKVEQIFQSFPEVVSVCRTTGMAEESEHVHPVNHSHYLIQLRPLEERKRGYVELTKAMREKLDKIPGIVYIFEQPIANKMAEMLTGTEGQIAVKLFGPDLRVLNEKIHEIRDCMSRIQGIADLQIEQTTGIPQILITLDREAMARYGVPVAEAADLIETALNGVEVTEVWEAERTTSVLLRLPEQYRQDVRSIENLLIDTAFGTHVPLGQIARISRTEGPQTIFRENLLRRKIVLCNVVGRDIGRFVQEARERIARTVSLPPGYFVTFGGQFESQQQTMRQLGWMMLVVGLSVLVVLFASLGSLGQSLVLLLNVPMTLAGGIVALLVAGQTLNVSSVIGFIALFGIALQNGVVLVGKINDLRRQGAGLHQAVLQGAVSRFRPILMTELILILGVVPLALGRSSGSEIHRPLAVVYIGGFLVAIFFEQLVLPILYEMISRSKQERLLDAAARS
ncbi:MAG: efflux RND transporter permease subunit [Thermoguttaceae bacterium]